MLTLTCAGTSGPWQPRPWSCSAPQHSPGSGWDGMWSRGRAAYTGSAELNHQSEAKNKTLAHKSCSHNYLTILSRTVYLLFLFFFLCFFCILSLHIQKVTPAEIYNCRFKFEQTKLEFLIMAEGISEKLAKEKERKRKKRKAYALVGWDSSAPASCWFGWSCLYSMWFPL